MTNDHKKNHHQESSALPTDRASLIHRLDSQLFMLWLMRWNNSSWWSPSLLSSSSPSSPSSPSSSWRLATTWVCTTTALPAAQGTGSSCHRAEAPKVFDHYHYDDLDNNDNWGESRWSSCSVRAIRENSNLKCLNDNSAGAVESLDIEVAFQCRYHCQSYHHLHYHHGQLDHCQAGVYPGEVWSANRCFFND